MEYIVFFIALTSLGVFLFFKNKKVFIKDKAIKKQELISEYENKMRSILNLYENDKEELKKQKIELLKKINYELSMNIFFEEEESKDILKKLMNMEK